MNTHFLDEPMEDAIFSWVVAASGLEATWANQDTDEDAPSAPVLPYPFVMLNIIAGPRSFGGINRARKSQDVYTESKQKAFTLAVHVYARDKHLDYMEQIDDSLDDEITLETLRAAGISIWDRTPPTDIPSLREAGHELHASMDIIMAYVRARDRTLGEIEKVEVTPTYDKGDEDNPDTYEPGQFDIPAT